MIAVFENGYFLEVEYDEEDNKYVYTVFDEEGYVQDYGHTEYRDISIYYPMNKFDYILEYCEPEYVEGKYKIFSVGSVEEYLDLIGNGYLVEGFDNE